MKRVREQSRQELWAEPSPPVTIEGWRLGAAHPPPPPPRAGLGPCSADKGDP